MNPPSTRRMVITSTLFSFLYLVLATLAAGALAELMIPHRINEGVNFEIFLSLRFGLVFALIIVLVGYCFQKKRWRSGSLFFVLPIIAFAVRWHIPPIASTLSLWGVLTFAIYQVRALHIQRQSTIPGGPS